MSANLSVQQSIQPSPNAMTDLTIKTPVSSNSNSRSYNNQSMNMPTRCFQNVRPPPPHNSVPVLNNNNNFKNNNKNWNGIKKVHEHKNEKANTQYDECHKNFHGKKSPEKSKTNSHESGNVLYDYYATGIKRLQEKNIIQNTIHHHFYSPNNQTEAMQSIGQTHFIPYFSPYYQRSGFFYKQRYFTNRYDRASNNRHKKRIPFSSDDHIYQVDILMERFLSHSSFVDSSCKPVNLKSGGVWDTLNTQIWDTFISCQQSEETYKNKIVLWKYLYTFIRNLFPRYGLFLVGSTMSGFGSDSSDVDMCLLVRPTSVDQRSEAPTFLEQIHNALQHCDFIARPELIWAKVPILKFHDIIRNIEVDLNCNNAVGIRNTHLLHCYANMDWRVRPLVLIVKLWARYNEINNAKNMTISSYSLALMVIHYLQCGVTPPVIPCLHGLYPEKFQPNSDIHSIDMQEQLHPFHSDNNQSLGELLVGFLHYYSVFDYSAYAISVRLGARIPIDECRMARSYKNDPHQWKYLCIEEPFDLTNTARSVYDPEIFEHVKSVFMYSYKQLETTYDLFLIFKLNDVKKL